MNKYMDGTEIRRCHTGKKVRNAMKSWAEKKVEGRKGKITTPCSMSSYRGAQEEFKTTE
jgi:hypothetical protein